MIAIGGYSAYLADILGYKIGKKRLSIKRIRPKYVARISVVVAGMLIPIFTMLLLYGVSSTFRTWITRGSEIVRDLEQKSKEVDKINLQLVDGEKKNAALENQNKISENRFNQKKKEADEQEKKAKELDTKVKTLDSSIRTLNASISNIKQEKASAQAQLGPLRKNLEVLQRQLPGVQKNLEEATKSLKEAETKYKDATKNYNSTSSRNLELTSKNGELQSKNSELQKTADDLLIVVDNINKALELLKGQKVSAEAATKQANEDLEIANEKLRQARLNTTAIARQIEYKFRTETISYLRGEELARTPISSKPTNALALTTYRSLLRRAKSIAKDHGAVPDPAAGFSGTAGMSITDPLRGELTEDEVENYWAEQLRKLEVESVLIARASINQFGSEPISLAIEVLPNPIVFRKGEIITETKIDGRISDIEILNTIREFLQTFVNTKARQRKMIPIQSRNGVSYGEYTQLLSTVALVKAVPRISRLVAVAAQDIRAGDSLDIAIEVR